MWRHRRTIDHDYSTGCTFVSCMIIRHRDSMHADVAAPHLDAEGAP